ncbi:hypothetical protein DFH07DRAFT_958552 [Mycena maculata]|uniref:Uncharacterized protein n=1 Tax=Mycena maculata TaxID=230809 RepID=A0AAD7NF19_9AGAR|nr:hypothetical protein DFH07DRAFT_958552 [Mycena maculata]
MSESLDKENDLEKTCTDICETAENMDQEASQLRNAIKTVRVQTSMAWAQYDTHMGTFPAALRDRPECHLLHPIGKTKLGMRHYLTVDPVCEKYIISSQPARAERLLVNCMNIGDHIFYVVLIGPTTCAICVPAGASDSLLFTSIPKSPLELHNAAHLCIGFNHSLYDALCRACRPTKPKSDQMHWHMSPEEGPPAKQVG